jgi:hypothetical protein
MHASLPRVGRRTRRAAALAACLVCLAPRATRAVAPDRLLTAADLTYSGAFRLPDGSDDEHSFSYGGTALAYDAPHDSLLLVGHDWFQRVAEISIPELRSSPSAVSGLATARLLQPLTDVLAGRLKAIGSGTPKVGGLLPIGDRLIVTAYLYYDGSGSQTLSHFETSMDFAHIDQVRGPFQVGRSGAGFVDGYMAVVPPEWRDGLGGAYVTGQCCIPIVSRTSFGPALSVFDPDTLADKRSQSSASAILGYPSDHQTLGGWSSSGALFSGATAMGGVVLPSDTRSVLFLGRHGAGPFCYGEGTRDRARAGTAAGDGAMLCFDPNEEAKGVHSFPYAYQVWAYDVLDLVAVRQGKRRPWDIKPYSTWTFDLPFEHSGRLIGGIAFDEVHRRLFVSASFGDGSRPLIHVFTVAR